jgi:putative solute:sodium symporter small subunit
MNTNASQKEMHWNRTRSLMTWHLVVWFIFSFVVHWFAPQLNKVSMFGWPLGFYMAAQGSPIAFVIQIFMFAKQQDRIDRECGMAEAE